ncbi:MAG: hypothetical protein AAB579_01665 [Patescibacteria group bacterium]
MRIAMDATAETEELEPQKILRVIRELHRVGVAVEAGAMKRALTVPAVPVPTGRLG